VALPSCPDPGAVSIRLFQPFCAPTKTRLIFRRLLALLFTYALLLQMVPHVAMPSSRKSLKSSSSKHTSEAGHSTFSSVASQAGVGAWTEATSATAGGTEVLPTMITDAVVTRHKPTLNSGRIEGTLRVLLGESFANKGGTQIT
jgi:hypothetical protein